MNNYNSSKVPFGLKNGILYEASDDQVERGKACSCICPSCNEPLIAKKGEKRKHHFTHNLKNSCQTGRETAIHLAAKQIISQAKTVCLPSIKLGKNSQPHGKVNFDKIILEKSIPQLKKQMTVIPDITARLIRGNTVKNLYIEIAVTHFTEEEKIDVLRRNKFSAIEIDLSHLYNEDHVDFAVIEKIIMNGENTTWIYNQKIEDEKERIRIEDEEGERRYKHFLNEKRKKIKNLINLYNEEKERKKDTIKWDKQLLEYSNRVLKISSLNDLPKFILEPCDIDALYPIDGRMVRLYIYEHFVLGRKNIPELRDRAFGPKHVFKYLKSKKKLCLNSFIYDWFKTDSNGDNYDSYFSKVNLDVAKPYFDAWIVIGFYLYSLTKEGVLEYREYGRGERFKLPSNKTHKKSHTIYPARTISDDIGFKFCKICNKKLQVSDQYCGNCLEVQ